MCFGGQRECPCPSIRCETRTLQFSSLLPALEAFEPSAARSDSRYGAEDLRYPLYLLSFLHSDSSRTHSCGVRSQLSLRACLTSRTGQSSVAGITRTLLLSAAFTSACELISSSIGSTTRFVSGFQFSVTSRSPGKIFHLEPSSNSTIWLSGCERIFTFLLAFGNGLAPIPAQRGPGQRSHLSRSDHTYARGQPCEPAYFAVITILQLLKDVYHLLYGSRRQDFLEWISHMVEVSKFELRSFRWLKGGASP